MMAGSFETVVASFGNGQPNQARKKMVDNGNDNVIASPASEEQPLPGASDCPRKW
jgi:hypothetical protein